MAEGCKADVLSGKIALVTGATRGIGKGIAQCMAEAGARVIVLGRDPAVAEAVSQELRDGGGLASPLVADLADEAQVGALIPRVLQQHGALDILVNNAGIDDMRPALGYPLDVWRRIIQLNLEVPFRLSQAVSPHFLEKSEGIIINLPAPFGLVGYATECAYASDKHGLTGLTKV